MSAVLTPTEQKVILTGVSWGTYEDLLADYEDSSSPRLNYDRGVLEIMVLSPKHELLIRTISLQVEVIAEETNTVVVNLGSTTFRREESERGFEADSCFYIKNAGSIKGKTEIDLTVDPPPDLVIEIDITRPSLDKFPIFAAMGVPEVWRYDGRRLTIFELSDSEYARREQSIAFSRLTAEDIS